MRRDVRYDACYGGFEVRPNNSESICESLRPEAFVWTFPLCELPFAINNFEFFPQFEKRIAEDVLALQLKLTQKIASKLYFNATE